MASRHLEASKCTPFHRTTTGARIAATVPTQSARSALQPYAPSEMQASDRIITKATSGTPH